MDYRLLLNIEELLVNGKPSQDVKCSISIQECADIKRNSVVPFPDKQIFDLPSFDGFLTLKFKVNDKSFAESSIHLTKLIDQDTFSLPIELTQKTSSKEELSLTIVAKIAAISRQVNWNMIKSSVEPAERSGSVIMTEKTYEQNSMQFSQRKISETVKPDEDSSKDTVFQKQEIFRIQKILTAEGNIITQHKVRTESETTKTKEAYTAYFEKDFDDIDDIEEEDDQHEQEHHQGEQEEHKNQEKSAPENQSHPQGQVVEPQVSLPISNQAQSTTGFHGLSTAGSGFHGQSSTGFQGQSSTGFYQYYSSRKEHADSLIGFLESKYGQSDSFAKLKASINDIVKFPTNMMPPQQGNLAISGAFHNVMRTTSSPTEVHNLGASPSQMGGFTPNFDPRIHFAQPFAETTPMFLTTSQHQQPRGEESKIQTQDDFHVPRDQKAQTFPLSKEADQGALGDKKRAISTEAKKKKRTIKEIHTREYLLDLNKSIKFAASAFVDEPLTQEIITQMSRNKKKLSVVRIKGNVEADQKESIKISAKNYFSENCNNKYLHYFMPYTKNLYLLNISKKVEDPSKAETFRLVELDIEFDISPHIKSLITPSGLLFAVAAKTEPNATTLDDSLGSCHLYHYSSQTLVEKATMSSFKRKNFGLVYFNKNLFAIGGFVQGQLSNSCERYDIRSNEWVPIASMERAVQEPTLCVYGNRYIYRFFGFNSKNSIEQAIERFDAIRNRWQNMKVDLHASMRDVYLPLSYQIGPNEILIFGGRNVKGIEATKGQAFLVSVEDKKGSQNIKINKCKNPLPGPPGILSQNSLIIEDNTLIAVREGKLFLVT